MSARMVWSRILVIAGTVAMLVGAIDLMEGSLVILPGSALVLLGSYLGRNQRRAILFWGLVFVLIAFGVGALFWLSSLGGFGGKSGRSMWWGVLILPYLVGWLAGLVGHIVRLVRYIQSRRVKAPA